MKWPFSPDRKHKQPAPSPAAESAGTTSTTNTGSTNPTTTTTAAEVSALGPSAPHVPIGQASAGEAAARPARPGAWLQIGTLATSVSQPETIIGARQFVDHLATRRQMVDRFEPRSRAADAPTGYVRAELHPVPTAADRAVGPAMVEVPQTPGSMLPAVALRRLPHRPRHDDASAHRGDQAGEGDGLVHPAVSPHRSVGDDGQEAPRELWPPSDPSRPPSQDPGSSAGQPSPAVAAQPIAELGAEPLPQLQAGRRPQRRWGLGAPVDDVPEQAVSAGGERIPDDIREAVQRATGTQLGDAVIDRSRRATEEASRFDATAFARDGVIHLPEAVGHADSPESRGLIAHELTHVAQQRRLGGSLPSEDSPEGRRLEAQARVAHQFFRGDPGAPTPGPLETIDRSAMLTTGVMSADERGSTTFSAVSPELIQRQVARSTTPNYAWQRGWLEQHHANAGMSAAMSDEFRLTEQTPDEATVGIERQYLDELKTYREQQRQLVYHNAVETEQRRLFAEIPAAAAEVPELPTDLPAADRPIAEQIRAAQIELNRDLPDFTHRQAMVTSWNTAVDNVEGQYPLRNFSADTHAVHQQPATPPPAQATLAGLRRDHAELVHRVLGNAAATTATPQPITGQTPAATTPMSSAPSSAPTTVGGTGPSPAGGPPSSGGGGRFGAAAAGAAAGAATAFAWEQGVFSHDAPSLSDGIGDLFRMTEPTDAERRAAEERAEATHIDPLRQARHDYFKQLVDQKVEEIRRASFSGGTASVLSVEDALRQITNPEWQAIVQTVERDRPIHAMTDENRLLADPRNSLYAGLIAVAPASRPTPGATPAATGTPAAGTAPGGAHAAATTAAPGGGRATTPAPHPTAHAGDHATAAGGGNHPAATAALAGGAAALGAHIATEHAHRPAPEPHEIEFSPELLRRLSAELYVRLRSKLRSELIVDRERAGVLTDFR